MKKFNKYQAHELLLSHEFVQGWTANTADWYTKNNQEIRITENGFSHWKYKIDKFHPTNFINSTLIQLENTIFQFRLNEKLIRRNYSLYPTFSPDPKNAKRRAKRVNIPLKNQGNFVNL